MQLEELESRLAPASFAVNAQFHISRLDAGGDSPAGTRAVVFFESAVANYQVLRDGLGVGIDAVVLDSAGDGVREMAAFLASQHDLTTIGIVAHGSPGAVTLGTATLDVNNLKNYSPDLSVIGSSLAWGGELDLWSCSVAAGNDGLAFVNGLASSIGAAIAASDHMIGAATLGGNWQLDVRLAGAGGQDPFSAGALGAFADVLSGDPDLADPSQSTITAAPMSIPVGGTAAIVLTARNTAGDQLGHGGSSFSFGLGEGTGNGLFTDLKDNNDGTYTATFTGTAVGPVAISASLDAQTITSSLPTIIVTAATPVVSATIAGGVYNGAPYAVTAASVTGLGGSILGSFGDPSLSYTYYVGNAASGTATATAPKDAGTYTVVAHWTSNNPEYASADSAPATFSITPAPLTVTAVANAKTFDGTTAATAIPIITAGVLYGSDTGNFTEAYDTPDVGTGKTLTPSASNNGNYTYTFVSVTTGVITPVGTTTTVATSSATLIYGTSVTLTAIVAPASGDIVPGQGRVDFFVNGATVLGTASYVGSDSSDDAIFTLVTGATQLQVDGGTAQPITANYTAGVGFAGSSSTNVLTETITPAPLALTGVMAHDKVYDSTTKVTLDTSSAALVGVAVGETVTLNTTGVIATFANKDVATGIAVTISGLALSGPQAVNYTLTQPTTTANITPAPLTVTGITASDKAYDATTAAALNTSAASLVGVYPGDTVGLARVAGPLPLVTYSYHVDSTFNQTPPISASFTIQEPITDGFSVGDIISIDFIVNGNEVSWTPSSGTIPDLVVNNSSGVVAGTMANGGFPTGGAMQIKLSVPQQSSYQVTFDALANTPSGDWASQGINVSFGHWLESGFLPPPPIAATGAFATKDAGADVPVAISGLTLSGAQAADYTLTPTTATANITPQLLAVTGVPNTKPFDGNTSAAAIPTITAGTLQGKDMASFVETYDTPAIGSGKTLTPSGGVADGNGGKNYTYLFVPVSSGVITQSPVTQLVITNLEASAITAGDTVTFSVTAEDGSGNPVPDYAGTIQLTSTDGGSALPTSYTFTASDNGTHTFPVTLVTAGNQTITATDPANTNIAAATISITVSAGPFSKFAVNLASGNTLVAGDPLLFTTQATDAFGNPVTTYGGPTSVTASASPPDPNGGFPVSGVLSGVGFDFFLGSLETAGTYQVTVSAGSVTGTSASFTVAPASVNYFTISVPPSAATGSPFNVTVSALDAFGNLATGYTGLVHFTSTDASAILPVDATLSGGVGTFSATLKSGGSQTITATDVSSTRPTITGTSNVIAARGLMVSSFTPTATGFTATFSKPFVPGDLTLYGAGLGTVQDVTLVGTNGPINGSLIVDPSDMSITFNATSNSMLLANNFGSPALPDDTYTVTLVSGTGSNGFQDALGTGLDGTASGGHANYTTTFTTHYQADKTPLLSIPDFARGPDSGHVVKVPNDSGLGIPITLYNAANVTDITFTLTYNPSLLNVTAGFGGLGSDATDASGSFTMVGPPTIIDATHAEASFHFADSVPQSETVVLGDVQATVPDSAAKSYKAKELLQLKTIIINQDASAGSASADAVHVNAYVGDVTGNGGIDVLDLATANNVAQGKDTGFAAYPLLDPALVGDPAVDYSVDAGDVSDLAAYTVHLPTPAIPAIPTGLTIEPGGPDPTLSLGATQRQGDEENGRQGETSSSPGLVVTVPVLLDHSRPVGSTGMTEAILALTYDPKVLSVSPSDIALGSLFGEGSDWRLIAEVDAATGQIGIEIFSTKPISEDQAGSLVNITFHVLPGQALNVAAVQLVSAVTANGQQFVTQVDDAQGQLVLTPIDDPVLQTVTYGWRRTHRQLG
jgi:hypothetical protein